MIYYVFYKFKTGEQCFILFNSYRKQQTFIRKNKELFGSYQAGSTMLFKAVTLDFKPVGSGI